MKRIIANKIILITTLAMLIFASFSVVIINYINVKMLNENVTNVFGIYEHITANAQDLDSFRKDIEMVPGDYRVLVYSTEGVAYADSNAESIEDLAKLPKVNEEKYFMDAMDDDPKISIIRSGIYQKDTIVLAKKIRAEDSRDSSAILVVSLPIVYNSAYIWAVIPLFILVVIIVLLLTSGFTNNLIKNAIAPLSLIQKNLEDINRGVYKKIDIKTNYREVERVVREINTFSSKISNSMDYLSYEQAKLGFILDNINQGLIAVSAHMNVVLTNKAALNIFGSSKNLLGSNIGALIEDKQLRDMVKSAIESNRNSILEYQIKSRDYRIEIIRLEAIRQEDSKGIDCIITLSDVTEEVNSAQIRSEFFANASHELKTPLTAVKGFAELLPEMVDDASKNKCAEEITKNTDRMLALIQDMLKLAKMDANVVDEEIECLDLLDMAESVKSNLQSIAEKKNVSVAINGRGKIYGHRKQIEEVVTNLIDNAIKYNRDDGKVTVTINENENNTTFNVEDTGIGIDAKHQSRIYERFYRVDKSRNRKVYSTGLGLSIVKHIVMQHSGAISLNSKLGEGTRFEVVFPSATSVEKSGFDK